MGLLLLLAAISPGWISAQASRDDGIRIGLAVGGISTVGVVVEFFDGNYGIDLTVGTWSFRDISVSAVGKRYVGDHAARPFLGLGLWLAAANPPTVARASRWFSEHRSASTGASPTTTPSALP